MDKRLERAANDKVNKPNDIPVHLNAVARFPKLDRVTAEILRELMSDPDLLGRSSSEVIGTAITKVLEEAMDGNDVFARSSFVRNLQKEIDRFQPEGNNPVRGSGMDWLDSFIPGDLYKRIVTHATRAIERDGAVLRDVDPGVNENLPKNQRKQAVGVLIALAGELAGDDNICDVGSDLSGHTTRSMEDALEASFQSVYSKMTGVNFAQWLDDLMEYIKRARRVLNNFEVNEAFGNQDADTIRATLGKYTRRTGLDEDTLFKRLYQASEFLIEAKKKNNLNLDYWPEVRELEVKGLVDDQIQNRDDRTLDVVPGTLTHDRMFIPLEKAGEEPKKLFELVLAESAVVKVLGNGLLVIDKSTPAANAEEQYLSLTSNKNKSVRKLMQGAYTFVCEREIDNASDLGDAVDRIKKVLDNLNSNYRSNIREKFNSWIREWGHKMDVGPNRGIEALRRRKHKEDVDREPSKGGLTAGTRREEDAYGLTVLDVNNVGWRYRQRNKVLNLIRGHKAETRITYKVRAGNKIDKKVVVDMLKDPKNPSNLRTDAKAVITKVIEGIFK